MISNKYTATDDNTLIGNNYYRIKMLESSGHYSYSDIRKVIITSKPLRLLILTNPAKNNLKFRISNMLSTTKALYQVYDITGKKRAEGVIEIQAGTNDHSISLPPEAGNYLLKIFIGKSTLMQQFVIQ
jgi:hypothetical protein